MQAHRTTRAAEDDENIASADNQAASTGAHRSSPVAPRFLRETMRGSKRQFNLSKYDGNVLKKQMVKPPNWTPHSAQQIDTWLYNQITHTVVARAKSLDREQLRLYLSETLLKKSTLPADIQTIRHVIDAMYTDYFQHYKNTVNKLRSDIKEEYTKIESNFFSVPKLRGADVCGRDKWQWYRETDAEAQRLKSAILNGTSGFRQQLVEKYTGYLQAHSLKESEISYRELQDCAKSPFFLILSLMCKCQLFDYMSYEFETFDEHTRAGDESFVINAWYCDLWEPNSNDQTIYSFDFNFKITELVRRDRNYVTPPSRLSQRDGNVSEGSSDGNERLSNPHEMFRKIIRRCAKFCPTLPLKSGHMGLDDSPANEQEDGRRAGEDPLEDPEQIGITTPSSSQERPYDPRMDPANWES